MSFEEWLQSRLTAHGFPLNIDGNMGPATTAAIKAFQKQHYLMVTGLATEATVAALRQSATADVARIPERDTDPAEAAPIHLPVKNIWPRQRDVQTFYGAVGANQTSLTLPWPMRLAWNRNQIVRTMTLHRRVAESAGRCLERIGQKYPAARRKELGLDLFAGSLNVRRMRGGSNYSMHSWGIAIDFDSERNQLNWGKDRARLAQADCIPFWEIWEDEGWLSLGRARNFDWMHVQAARL